MQLHVRWEHGGLWGTEEKESSYQEKGRDIAVEVALGACDQWKQVVHSGKQQQERHGNVRVQGVWSEQGLDAPLGSSPSSSFFLPPSSFLLPNSLNVHLGINPVLGKLLMEGGMSQQAMSQHIPLATGIGAGADI